MNNRKFLYGVGVGVLGYNIIYSLIKDKLHPMAVNIAAGAISMGSATKSFIEDVNEKAMTHREERFKRVASSFDTKPIKRNEQMSENIQTLKKQLTELKNKIK